MEEKDLLKNISEESELKVPNVYDKVVTAANEQGLFNEKAHDEQVYSDGETIALGGVNRKAVAITTLASVAAVCLAIALPIALSGKLDSGVPNLAEKSFGNDYAVGAVATAKLAESFLDGGNGGEAKATSLILRSGALNADNSDITISEFDSYFYAFNSFFGEKPVSVKNIENDNQKYDNYVELSGTFSNGVEAIYRMYYSESRILDNATTTGEARYHLEGELSLNNKLYTLVGERVYSDATKENVKSLTLIACPTKYNENSLVEMSVEYSEDGSASKYAFTVIKDGSTISESLLSFPKDNAYAFEFFGDDGERDGKYTVNRPQTGSDTFAIDYEIGGVTSVFTGYATSGTLEKVRDALGLIYTCNSDGTCSLSDYDKSQALPTELLIPAEVLGKKVVRINNAALSDCEDISKVVMPDGIVSLGNYAFSGCTNLSEIELSGNLEAIGNAAFERCEKLKLLNIPASVNSIGLAVFNRTFIETVTVDSANQTYFVSEGCLIEKATKTLIAACVGFKIPDDGSVNVIGEKAFYWCWYSNELVIVPDSVKVIESEAFSMSRFLSFELDGVQNINDAAFADSAVYYVRFSNNLLSIGGYAFANCKNLYAIDLPASLMVLGNHAFGSSENLKSITVDEDNYFYSGAGNCLIEKETKTLLLGCSASVIPDDGSVEIIGEEAFVLSGITQIILPSSIKKIGRGAFMGCEYLTEINFTGTAKEWYDIDKLEDWDLDIGDYVVKCTDGILAKDGSVIN